MPMDLRQQVLAAINVEKEAEELLGRKKRNGNYSCYNKAAHSNSDANPSLSINSSSGLYICHACGVKGDIFQLLMDCRGMDRKSGFGSLLKQLAAKYGLQANTVKFEKKREVVQKIKGFKYLGDKPVKDWLYSRSKVPTKVYEYLMENYGLGNQTVDEYQLGFHSRRLWIPIPAKRFDNVVPKTKVINVRKHDVMRKCCRFIDEEGNVFDSPVADSKPYWGERGGKVIGIRNHNVAYVYPMWKLIDNAEIWLVGGELKALLLNQFGIPAVCFTSGEGRYHKDLLKFFTNKIVRVVMDIDDAGERATFGDEKRHGLAQVIADNGAKEVYGGRLPKIEGMPANGDVTDYLRLNGWNTESLSQIDWEEFKPKPVFEAGWNDKIEVSYDMPAFDQVEFSDFGGLLSPKNAGKVIKIPFVVAGRGETPYLLPSGVKASCEAGQMDARPICQVCPMSRNNFDMKATLAEDERIDLVGLSPAKVRAKVADKLRLPKCHYPDIQVETDSVEKLVVIPTIDGKHAGDQFNYRQHAVYALGDDYLMENVSYEGIGRVLPEPRNSQYTWAMVKKRALDNDIFNYTHKEDTSGQLIDMLHSDTMKDSVDKLVDSLRDNYLHKYGVDDMILYELLAFFMPFEFSLGKYRNYKVCPEVCILGEPRSGKSSTAKDLLKLFGAGRYVDAPTVTTIGLIGGNSSFGNSNIFTWGAIPMCHRAICVIDECNKLSIETIETLTNLRSSGIAERTTVSGIRKIRSNVRFLWLCNPRGGRSLQHYGSPVRAAQEVFGSPQDLARLDLLHIQKAQRDARMVNRFHESTTENFYTSKYARYHLQWAWSLKEDDVVFEDPIYIMDKAVELVQRYKTPLLPMAETKFKIARIAAGLSALTYQLDRYNKCFVSNESVDLAFSILDKYKRLNVPKGGATSEAMPTALKDVLDRLQANELTRLKAFIVQDMMTMGELKDLFGPTWTIEFIQTAFYEMDLMKRRRNYFMWDEQLREYMKNYIEDNKGRESSYPYKARDL